LEASLSRKPIAGAQPGADSSHISYHVTRLRVPLFEVDLGQAVYHGNYFHLFEMGREDFLRSLGFPYREFMNRGLHLTIVGMNCAYRKPLVYDDQIDIYTGISWTRKRSIGFSQLIQRPGKGDKMELCTTITFDMVCVTFSGRPTSLPADFMTMARDFSEKHAPSE